MSRIADQTIRTLDAMRGQWRGVEVTPQEAGLVQQHLRALDDFIGTRGRLPDPVPLTEDEETVLSRYNSEKIRGVMHTDAWKTHMAALQERWDATQR